MIEMRFLVGPTGSASLPHKVRINSQGMASIVDVIVNVSFVSDEGCTTKSCQSNALTYFKRLGSDYPELTTDCASFKFPGRGQHLTPVAGRNTILQIIQVLRGKKAAKFRHNMATLLEKYLDADMGLADDITDRALDAHLAELRTEPVNNQPQEESMVDHKRIKSRDSTKTLGEALKQAGARREHYGKTHGGINQAIVGMPTAAYRQIQVNLKNKEVRNAFTESMLGMSATVNCLVRDNLNAGKTLDDQLLFVNDSCKKAAELLGLHQTALEVQPKSYIEGNKQVMAQQRTADKRARLCAPGACSGSQNILKSAKRQKLITGF